jgi:adenosylmethionine-8-amino-7-oxononanoate aminotransferase
MSIDASIAAGPKQPSQPRAVPERDADRDGSPPGLESITLWRPYCQMKTAAEPLHVVAAGGAWLELASGQRIIDAIASWWTACHGHRHPHIVAAIVEQARTLPHVMLGGIDHPQAVRLADRLARLMPGSLNHSFFCDSGSVAVEVAMKMAAQYWMNRGQAGRKRFVCLRHSYHGDTSGAMSVCDPDDSMHRHFRGFLLEQYPHELPSNEAGWRSLTDFLHRVRGECAALIVEPLVQCATGMRFHSPEQLRRLVEIAREAGLLVIADEIATGLWRTGRLLACDWAGVVPDILCLGKALTGGTLPLAVTMATTDVFAAFWSEDPDHALMHGPTYMGNPLCCAAANASLDLFAARPVAEEVAAIERQGREWLAPLASLPQVREVRCRGGFLVVETTQPFDRKALMPLVLEHSVWLRPIGSVLYATPPLTITADELRQVTDAMAAAVRLQR